MQEIRRSDIHMTTNRVETLVDGIFAISMTLLVLNLRLPQVEQGTELGPRLVAMWPHFLSYALSFYLLAVFWVIHHKQFRHVKETNEPLLWLNVLALVFVALIPFSTSLQGEYGNLQAAAVFFEGNLLAAGLAFSAQYMYATKDHRLVDPDLDQKIIDVGIRKSMIIPAASVVAIALSFVNPGYSTMTYVAIPFVLRNKFFRVAS